MNCSGGTDCPAPHWNLKLVGELLTQLMSRASTDVDDDDVLYRATPGVVALLSVLYGSLSVAAVLGNVLVIAVVATNRSMQTVTNFFIANLSGADVVVGVFSIPFQFQAALLQPTRSVTDRDS